MNAVANITPANDTAMLSDIAAQIKDLLRQRGELNEDIRAKYQEAAELGVPKAGFKLAVAHSRMSEERRADIQHGFKLGANALGMQMDLFAELREVE